MLKRKLDETVDDSEELDNATTSNGQSESDNSNCSAGSTDALAPEVASGPSPPKRMKKKVNFKGVTVFYFPRKQGFTCVPSEGGSTLGMSEKHSFHRDFTLSDYTKEQKRIHRAILAEQRRQGKLFPSPLLASSLPSPDTEDDVSSGSESDSEYDDYYFLQPLPIRQRRVLLRTAGVKKIDNDEKDECRDIRVSRNVCGCDCKLFCDPAACPCSLAGIQCQVDRLSFPCGCAKDGCCNPAGRIEFNPIRVRTHFIHTLMRLELERKDSECPQGNSAAATTSCFSPKSSSMGVEIDVVGAVGEEGEEISPDMTDGGSDDSCSGASTDTGTSGGSKVLKSRLKAKKAESIDLNMFNSNEKGSCRDCQNTDMCNVMMHDLKFSMVTQQHQRQQQQHQQHMISAALGSQPGYAGTLGPQLQQHHHLGLSSGISLLHPPPPLPPPPQQQQSPQHMLLFNDGEEEVYQAESTTSMYFDIDDNSYPEVNDTPPDTLETRPFSSLTSPGFPRKFHVPQSQKFVATGINLTNSSSNGTVHSQTSGMSPQISLLNPACIKRLQVNRLSNNSAPSSCTTMEIEQQRSCGLMTQDPQISIAASCSKSLLKPPCAPHAHTLPSGQSVGPEGVLASRAGLPPQSGHLTCTQLESSVEFGVGNNNAMIPSSFQSSFAHTEILEPAVHGESSVFKLESSILSDQEYTPSISPVNNADYLGQSNNFSNQTTNGLGSLTSATVSNDDNTSFQHPSCWNSSLTGPTMRECFSVESTSPTAASSSVTQQTSETEISCSPTCQQESEACSVVLSPASSVSSAITYTNMAATTYTTMTATTHDRLAADCPGISSHVDGRPEPSTSIVTDSAPTFLNYPMTGMDSDVSSLVGTNQNLLYDLPYPDASTMEPPTDLSVTCATVDMKRKSTDPQMDSFLNQPSQSSDTSFSQAVSSPLETMTTPLTSEILSTSPVCSDKISSTSLPSSFPPSSLTTSLSSTSSAGNDQTVATGYTSVNHLSTPTQIKSPSENTPPSFSEDCLHSQSHTAPNVSSVIKDVNEREASRETKKKASSDLSNLNDAHLVTETTKPNLKEQEESACSWRANDKEHLKDTQIEKLPLLTTGEDCDQNSKSGDCGIVSIASLSTLQSVMSSSTTPSSAVKASKEGEEEKKKSQDFGEIMKESVVEMVLV